MKTISLIQGSQEWHEHREKHYNASDAPAMLDVSPYKSRAQLVKEYATGQREEPSNYLQKIFDDGHRFEALARPLAEAEIDEELYPIVGVKGDLSASFDGLTIDESKLWEHKSMSERFRNVTVQDDLPEDILVQIQQQFIVSGAYQESLFTASAWDDDDMLIEIVHVSVLPDKNIQKRITNGWKQFKKDVEEYKKNPADEPVKVSAEPQMDLPAVSIKVNGEIALIDNLDVFADVLKKYIDNINTSPETDQDFANLEGTVKVLKRAEDALLSEEARALSQTEAIDNMRRKVKFNHDLARTNRLLTEKIVKSEKQNRKNTILQSGKDKLAEYIAKLNKRVNNYMPIINADFAGAMSGKKTISSLQNAVDTVLAHAKIEADETADLIEANLNLLIEHANDYKFLFADTRDLIMKAADDLEAVIKTRIADHEKAESERREAEQLRIRIADQEKAESERREAEQSRIRVEPEPVTSEPVEMVRLYADNVQSAIYNVPEINDDKLKKLATRVQAKLLEAVDEIYVKINQQPDN